MIPVIELGSLIMRAVKSVWFRSFCIIGSFALVGTAIAMVVGWGVSSIFGSLHSALDSLFDFDVVHISTDGGELWAFISDFLNLEFVIRSLVVLLDIIISLVVLFPVVVSTTIGTSMAILGWRLWRQVLEDFLGMSR